MIVQIVKHIIADENRVSSENVVAQGLVDSVHEMVVQPVAEQRVVDVVSNSVGKNQVMDVVDGLNDLQAESNVVVSVKVSGEGDSFVSVSEQVGSVDSYVAKSVEARGRDLTNLAVAKAHGLETVPVAQAVVVDPSTERSDRFVGSEV